MAPTRLEIISNVKHRINEIMDKIPVDYLTHFSSLLKYEYY